MLERQEGGRKCDDTVKKRMETEKDVRKTLNRR